jgi:lysylphosphatidylglycerol synthetase-like protein (DUF2156 family)
MMTDKEKKYVPLPGRGRKFFGFIDPGRYRLWLVEDHILNVRSTGFSEKCKRFYLKDIQAIVISRTTTATTVNMLLVMLMLFFGLILLLALFRWESHVSVIIIFSILTGMLALIFAANMILGPTCLCRLHTDVQVEDLIALSRLRTAQRTISILKPLIEAAQGALTPLELETPSREHVRVAASQHALSPESILAGKSGEPALAETPASRHESGNIHFMVFLILLVLALTSYIDIFFQHYAKNLVDTILFVAMMVMAVVAIRRHRKTDIPPGIRRIPWAALIISIASFFFMQVYQAIYYMSNPGSLDTRFELNIKYEGPVFVAYCAVVAIAFSLMGILGLIRLSRFRAAYSVHQKSSEDVPVVKGTDGP